LTLAPEILEKIVLATEPSILYGLASVCKRLHPITARVLYRSPIVDDNNSYKFLSTIASPSTSINYSGLIRILTLSLVEDSIIELNPVFCDALRCMESLSSLNLSLPIHISTQLLEMMRSTDIIWSTSPFFSNISARLTASTHMRTGPALPHLTSIAIRGDNNLVDIAKFRTITALKILEPMKLCDVLELISALTGNHLPNRTISRLAVTFALDGKDDTRRALDAISDAMPCLEFVDIFSMYDDALVSLRLSTHIFTLISILSDAIRIFLGESKCLS